MGNIGGEIATGAANALFGIITHIPLTVWLILMGGTIIFGILMRYLTNWKVDLVIVGAVVVFSTVVYYREHWINMGYNQALARVTAAEAQVAAFKKTNGLIEACYARNTSATILWDRTDGKCKRADGSTIQ